MVTSAVGFLRNENIKQAAKDKKIAFLQKKGLTNEEIQEAFSRADQSSKVTQPSSSSSSSSSLPPLPPPPPNYLPNTNYPYPVGYPMPPPQPREWYATKSGLALTAIACVGIGVGVSYLAQVRFQKKHLS